jgi:hypothetical protein
MLEDLGREGFTDFPEPPRASAEDEAAEPDESGEKKLASPPEGGREDAPGAADGDE